MLTTLAIASLLLLDDGSGEYGVGGSRIRLKGNNSIRMVSEKVRAVLPDCEVKVTFVFKNEGAETDVLMAFPETGGYAAYIPRNDPDVREKTHFSYFRSWIDGRRVKVFRRQHERTFGDGYYYTNWWVKNVHFKRHQTRTIVDAYQGEPGWPGTGLPHTTSFSYILETGGTWKGPIGEGTVEIDVRQLEKKYNIDCFRGYYPDPKKNIAIKNGIAFYQFKNLNATAEDNIEVWWTKKGLKRFSDSDD